MNIQNEKTFERFQRSQEAWLWWRANCRPEVPADSLGLNKYFPSFGVYAADTFFTLPEGRNSRSFKAICSALGIASGFENTELDQKGTFTSLGTMQRYLADSGLMWLFRVEFEMYAWHIRSQNVEMAW